ncbi:hypothetical protein N8314_00740 [Akkermansiaceae bacterium]|nr:hypothetical protein [Akkermansiaceae bacterium]
MAGLIDLLGKNAVRRQQRKALEEAAKRGEYIPKSNLPNINNGQVNTNVRPPIDGEVVPTPSGFLNAPQGQIGVDGVMVTPSPPQQGLLGSPAPRLPAPDAEPGSVIIPPAPPKQGLLPPPNNSGDQLPMVRPDDIDPKTGLPYGKAAGAAGIVAGGGVLLGMDGDEGSANANLTPEQIAEDKAGRDQMIKDAEDIKSGKATPDQLVRATNFQRREAEAAGNELPEISRPEGVDQGMWNTLSDKFDFTTVGLALMASSSNGDTLGANLGKALQAGVLSADQKREDTSAQEEKARLEAKRDKVRNDALALAESKYADSIKQQGIVNAREDEKVKIQKTKAVMAEMAAEAKRQKAIAEANSVSTKTPTRNEMFEVAGIAKTSEDLGFKIDVQSAKGNRLATSVIYSVRNQLAAMPNATPEDKVRLINQELKKRFEKDGGFAFWDRVEVDPINQSSATAPAQPANPNTIMINGIPVTKN